MEKDPYKAKYQLLIKKLESVSSKDFYNSKTIVEYSNDIDDIYENIDEYNSNGKVKDWLLLMIWLLICLTIKKLNAIVTQLFVWNKKNFSSFHPLILFCCAKKH